MTNKIYTLSQLSYKLKWMSCFLHQKTTFRVWKKIYYIPKCVKWNYMFVYYICTDLSRHFFIWKSTWRDAKNIKVKSVSQAPCCATWWGFKCLSFSPLSSTSLLCPQTLFSHISHTPSIVLTTLWLWWHSKVACVVECWNCDTFHVLPNSFPWTF